MVFAIGEEGFFIVPAVGSGNSKWSSKPGPGGVGYHDVLPVDHDDGMLVREPSPKHGVVHPHIAVHERHVTRTHSFHLLAKLET